MGSQGLLSLFLRYKETEQLHSLYTIFGQKEANFAGMSSRFK
jgi:hypothetical protein